MPEELTLDIEDGVLDPVQLGRASNVLTSVVARAIPVQDLVAARIYLALDSIRIGVGEQKEQRC